MSSKPKGLVTGGRGALGSAVASRLLEAGYEVHITSITEGAESAPGVPGVIVHRADMANEDDVSRVFQEMGGPLAALVATMGGYRGGPLASVTAEDIDHLTSMNLKGTILSLGKAHPLLKENPGGAGVVLVAARGAVVGGPGSAVYAASKAAVANLALSAAQEWLEDGISVNAILPSTMDTSANRRDMPDADFSRWPTTQQVAEVVAFLVSEEARIVSGAAIPVYGRA